MSNNSLLVVVTLLMIAVTTSLQSDVYSLSPRFEVRSVITEDELAHAIWTDSDKVTGWNRLHIHTSPHEEALVQHQAAGYLEGWITYDKIYSQYVNVISTIFGGNTTAPTKIQNFLDEQLDYMYSMIK